MKHFGGLVAVDTVLLELRPGEVHGLIRPNGSGKTTLLNLTPDYYQIDDGRIQLGGEDVTGRSVRERARAGLAILPVEQLVEKALVHSDRCHLMATGRIVHEGLAHDLAGCDVLHSLFLCQGTA